MLLERTSATGFSSGRMIDDDIQVAQEIPKELRDHLVLARRERMSKTSSL